MIPVESDYATCAECGTTLPITRMIRVFLAAFGTSAYYCAEDYRAMLVRWYGEEVTRYMEQIGTVPTPGARE